MWLETLVVGEIILLLILCALEEDETSKDNRNHRCCAEGNDFKEV